MEVYRRSSWLFFLLGVSLLATALQGVQGEVESEGPSESECRPYIEKALKELETGEAGEILSPDPNAGDSKEDIPTVEITTDDSSHQVDTDNDTDDGDGDDDVHDDDDNSSKEAADDDDDDNNSKAESVEENDTAEADISKQEEIVQKIEKVSEEKVHFLNSLVAKISSFFNAKTKQPDKGQEILRPYRYKVEESDEKDDKSDEAKTEQPEKKSEEELRPYRYKVVESEEKEDDPKAEQADKSEEETRPYRYKVVESDEKDDDAKTEEPDKKSEEELRPYRYKVEESEEKEEDPKTEQPDESEEETRPYRFKVKESEEKDDSKESPDSKEEAADTKEDSKEASDENDKTKSVEELADSGEHKEESDEQKDDDTKEESIEKAESVEQLEEAPQADEPSAESKENAKESAEAQTDDDDDSKAKEADQSSEELRPYRFKVKESEEKVDEPETKQPEKVQEELRPYRYRVEESDEVEEPKTKQPEKVQEELRPYRYRVEESDEKEDDSKTKQPEKIQEELRPYRYRVEESDEKDDKKQDDKSSEELRPYRYKVVESDEKDDKDSKEAADEDSKEDSEEQSGEAPEEELTMDIEIPSELRPRDHVERLLKLDSESSDVEEIINKVSEITLRKLKELYENAIKPLEVLYKYRDLSNRHFGDAEIFSKPLILFMGPWSGGKSSIINYLVNNEYNETSLRTGAEPSPAYFNILMHGDEVEVLDGTELAADYTFSGLQKFGQGLEERLRGLKLPTKLLEKVNVVEIPGILEVRKQVSRVFPFNDACQWFIDRADIIFLIYDPSKLDVGPETEAILDQLKGREHQTRIILNKADQVKPEELMRVQGALIWNISPLMSSPQPPVMYTTSLWSRPYEPWAPVRLLQAQERAFLRDLRGAVDKRIENKIASARRFAVRVRNHAKMVDCYLTTYYNHKSVFGNRKQVADEIIEHPQDYHIYEGLSTLTNISRYDLPDPDVYKDFFKLNPLYEFQPLSATCTYFRGCPINRLDIAIAYDLPELVGTHKKLVESALAGSNPSTNTPPAS